jgi:hypothetical protein
MESKGQLKKVFGELLAVMTHGVQKRGIYKATAK